MLPFANYISSSPPPPLESKKKKKKRTSTRVSGGGRGSSSGCGRGGDEQLAVVKAAAWAWYQRNEEKPTREFNLTRSQTTPRPSRYKVEAMKKVILSENRILAENRFSRSLCSTPSLHTHKGRDEEFSHLLDKYGIETISKRLDCLSDSSPNRPINFHEHLSNKPKKIFYGGEKNNVKKISRSKLLKEILLRPTAVCGGSDDVDLRAFTGSSEIHQGCGS